MKSVKDYPDFAFPFNVSEMGILVMSSGLTKREYFAGLAMQAMLSSYEQITMIRKVAFERGIESENAMAMIAVKYAEALLKELVKNEPV